MKPLSARWYLREAPFALLCAGAAWFAFAPFAPLGVDAHHDGLLLHTAADVAAGKELFKETFMQYGAYVSYVQALCLRWFGGTMLALKLATVAFYAVAAGLFYLAWRAILPRALALASVGVWMLFAYFFDPDWTMLIWSSVYALVPQALALLCLLAFARGPESARRLWAAAGAGFFAAATYLFRQPVGLSLFAACAGFVFVLPRLRRRHGRGLPLERERLDLPAAGACVGGFALGVAPFLAWTASRGALGDWYQQTMVIPARWAQGHGVHNVLPRLFWRWPTGLEILAFLAVLLGVASWARSLARRRAPRARLALGALAVAGAALLAAELAFPRAFRLLHLSGGWASAIPAVVLLAVGAAWRRRGTLGHSGQLLLAVGAVSLVSWLQYFPVVCERHIFWGITPSIGAFVAVLYRWTRQRQAVVLAVLALSFAPGLSARVSQARAKLAVPYHRFTADTPLKGMAVSHARAESAIIEPHDAISRYLERHPGKAVLVEGPDALMGALSPTRKGAGPVFMVWSGLALGARADRDAARGAFLKVERPVVYVHDHVPDGLAEYAEWLRGERGYRVLWRSSDGRQIVLVP